MLRKDNPQHLLMFKSSPTDPIGIYTFDDIGLEKALARLQFRKQHNLKGRVLINILEIVNDGSVEGTDVNLPVIQAEISEYGDRILVTEAHPLIYPAFGTLSDPIKGGRLKPYHQDLKSFLKYFQEKLS